MTYQAIFERADDGTIWGFVRELPGALGSGDTLEEARKSIEEGVAIWIEVARSKGDAIPAPSTLGTAAIEVSAA